MLLPSRAGVFGAMLRVLCLLAFVSLTPAAVRAQTPYFPPLIFDSVPERNDFVVRWYVKHLRAMREPSLWETSRNPKNHVYRLLWLRTFHKPISVRLAVNDDGTGLLTVKILSGQGGYEPGRLVTNRTRRLSRDQVDLFLEQVDEANFWNLPTKEEEKQQGTEVVVGLDGAQWILEGVKDGTYHVVDRWSPESGVYRALCLTLLLNFANLKLLYEEVY